MSRYRTAAGWSAGLLASAAAALLTASATLPGSAAHLEVDGGVLQVFVLDGPDDLPGLPGGPTAPPDDMPGPPDGVLPGPSDGVLPGPPVGVPGGPSDVSPPSVGDAEQPTGPQAPSDRPSDEQPNADSASGEPESDGSSPSDQGTEQQQPVQDPAGEADAEAATLSASTSEVRYENCAQVREAGVAPLAVDDPGYRPELDDDGDGRACEEGEG